MTYNTLEDNFPLSNCKHSKIDGSSSSFSEEDANVRVNLIPEPEGTSLINFDINATKQKQGRGRPRNAQTALIVEEGPPVPTRSSQRIR